MSKSKKSSVDRRGFLKGAAAGAAALAGPSLALKAQDAQPAQQQGGGGGRGGRGARGGGNQGALAREDGSAGPVASARVIEHPGSDYMVDVIKAMGIEFVAFNPGS